MSNPASVTLKNQTPATLIFGLWSAPHNHYLADSVGPGHQVTKQIDHPDSRIVGVWTDSNDLYKDNADAFTGGAFFAPGGSYTVTATTSGLTITG